ncbi:YlaH-like family protein [Anaerobacillus sp. MEB173]|uniref:YlaH-like family protein n=1 Tax=Anaerobacillus sp. MEB173 TaxID=3383345 RepID=UPI003F8EFB26
MVRIDQNPILGYWLLYALIVILCIVVYNLGFARKLPLLKAAIVYICLFIGCVPITIFAIGMPVIESLLLAAIVLGVYRYKLNRTREQEAKG